MMCLHLVAVVEDQVDGFGNFGDGFEPVLADLEAEQRGKFELALRHPVRRLAEQRNAVLPAEIPPAGINGPGRGDGFAHVKAATALKPAEDLAGVGGSDVVKCAYPGLLR